MFNSQQGIENEIFVCPVCQGSLNWFDQGYHCAACQRDYPILDGIPDFYLSAGDEDGEVWRDNLAWVDPQMVEARDVIYRLSVRELVGMTFAMQQVGLRSFPGCRILEVGTGTGHFARWMAEVSAPGTEIYSIDFSWPMLAKARLNTAGQLGVILLRANATEKLPFRPQSFDLVFLRLAPLGEHGMNNNQAAFNLLKPGGWFFKAGWKLVREDTPWTEAAIQVGYVCAEVHEWQYTRLKTREEYAASQVELERAIAFGAPFEKGPEPAWERDRTASMTYENLRMARKPGK